MVSFETAHGIMMPLTRIKQIQNDKIFPEVRDLSQNITVEGQKTMGESFENVSNDTVRRIVVLQINIEKCKHKLMPRFQIPREPKRSPNAYRSTNNNKEKTQTKSK